MNQDVSRESIDIYVDGTFKDGVAIGGFIAVINDEEVHKQTARVTDLNALKSWNIAAELKATVLGTLWAEKNGFKKVVIHHDYLGIAYWVVPDPKTKKNKLWDRNVSASKKYHTWMKARSIITEFVHTKGHSGIKWNEAVDAYVGDVVDSIVSEEIEVE